MNVCGKDKASASYLPDGRRIASRSADKTVRVWDAASGECVEMIEGRGDVAAIAGGEKAFPLRALVRGQEGVIESSGAADGEPSPWACVARFPQVLWDIATHPSGRLWAGGVANYLCLLQLEGEVATKETPGTKDNR